MTGDISRNTFDAANHFSQVLMQQGRVQLDADWNEQASILLHYLRTLAADLIGPHAGPAGALGFEIQLPATGRDLIIGAGRYYVDGILCENEEGCTYSTQPDYPLPDDDLLDPEHLLESAGDYGVYLDVWERHITYLDDSGIREVALGGPDTTTRAKIVWQVKIIRVPASENPDELTPELNLHRSQLLEMQQRYPGVTNREERIHLKSEMGGRRKYIARLQRRVDAARAAAAGSCDAPVLSLPVSDAHLQAQVKSASPSTDPCLTAPDSKYRGAENQLYRVEIHQAATDAPWSFKWSRDNGSIAAAIVKSNGLELTVYPARGFAAGQWVELTNAGQELRGEPGTFVKVTKVESDILTVNKSVGGCTKVRRWDQSAADGAVEGKGGQWIDLEQGIQVRFEPGSAYRSGDYWLIPARVATGKIEWPLDENDQPAMLPARGIEHHYAPLAKLHWNGSKLELIGPECRCTIDQAATCPTAAS